jgi:FAD/FMN-containing dehydrogenase
VVNVQVLKICKAHNTPVVTRGAGTGLSGGAMPLEESVVLGLSKLNRIKSIDAEKRLAVLEPGVRNIAISEAVAEFGLYYAPDPISNPAGIIPASIISATAFAQSRTESNPAITTRANSGIGVSFTVTSVIYRCRKTLSSP